jgi:hypothetical protein
LAAGLTTVTPAFASTGPVIESESVSHVTGTDATLEAQVNTEGLEASYEVWLGTVGCIEENLGATCESTGEGEIVGTLGAGSSPQTVSLDAATAWHDLSPGTRYVFVVRASSSAGKGFGDYSFFDTRSDKAPVIESESVSHVTDTDATLEAQINTEGLETTYEFNLASPPCPSLCEHLQHFYPLPSGKLLGSFVTQSVSLDLNSASVTLTPGERYEYWVTATNADGTVSNLSSAQTFAASAELPVIESESASHVTSSDATLEAQLNPNGHNDWAQFQLVEEPSYYASEILCPESPSPGFSGCVGPHSATALPLEFVPGNAAHPEPFEIVSLDLASAGVTLKPATTYHYRVLAAPAVQTEDTIQWEEPTIFGADQTFTTASDPPMPDASSAGNQPAPTWSLGPTAHHRRHLHRRHRRRNHRHSHRSRSGA